jgi:hypothetical protein
MQGTRIRQASADGRTDARSGERQSSANGSNTAARASLTIADTTRVRTLARSVSDQTVSTILPMCVLVSISA